MRSGGSGLSHLVDGGRARRLPERPSARPRPDPTDLHPSGMDGRTILGRVGPSSGAGDGHWRSLRPRAHLLRKQAGALRKFQLLTAFQLINVVELAP